MAEQKVSVIVELIDKASASLKKINTETKALAAGAIALLTAAIYKGVDAFQAQEKASAGLAAAMKNGGIYTREAQKAIEDYSTALSRSTTFADEEITAASTLFAQYGHNTEQIKQLTQASADLAAAKNIDIEVAAEMISKSLETGTAIRGVALDLKGAAGSTERLDSLVKSLGDTFGGRAKADAATFSGSMKQLGNAVGEIFELIGSIVAPAIQFVANGLTALTNMFLTMNPGIQTTVVVIAGLALGFLALIPLIIAGSAAMGFLTAATATFGAVAAVVFSPIVLIIAGIVAGITAAYYAIDSIAKLLKGDVAKQISDIDKRIEKLKESSKQVVARGGQGGEVNNKILSEIDNLEKQKTALQETHAKDREDKETIRGQQVLAKKQSDFAQQQALDAEQADAINAAANQRLQQWDLSQEERRQIEIQRAIDLENLKGQAADQTLVKRLNSEKATNDIILKMKQDQAQKWNEYEGFMASATTSKNKEVAAVAKAISIKNIIAKTAEAAMGAYASLAGIPFVGPILGAIAAGAAIAFGGEQVAQVQALADGGSFVADQPTSGNIGGQPIKFGEAGPEAVTFQPLGGNQGAGGGDTKVFIEGRALAKYFYQTQTDMLRTGELAPR